MWRKLLSVLRIFENMSDFYKKLHDFRKKRIFVADILVYKPTIVV